MVRRLNRGRQRQANVRRRSTGKHKIQIVFHVTVCLGINECLRNEVRPTKKRSRLYKWVWVKCTCMSVYQLNETKFRGGFYAHLSLEEAAPPKGVTRRCEGRKPCWHLSHLICYTNVDLSRFQFDPKDKDTRGWKTSEAADFGSKDAAQLDGHRSKEPDDNQKQASLSAPLPSQHIRVSGWITPGACGPRPGILQRHSSSDMCMDTVRKTSSNTQLVTRWSNQGLLQRMSIMGQERGGDDEGGGHDFAGRLAKFLSFARHDLSKVLIKVTDRSSSSSWCPVHTHTEGNGAPSPRITLFFSLPFSLFPSDDFSISPYLLPAVPTASERKVHVKSGQTVAWALVKRSARR